VIPLISVVTQATEQEKIAKALVYMFEDKNKTYELITNIIAVEVLAPETTTGTLFRSNSLATKMYSQYPSDKLLLGIVDSRL
jgi:hypothetical protein